MTSTLTQRHRAQQLLLRKASQAQAARVFRLLEYDRLDATYPSLAVSAADLVAKNRQTSAGLAAGYIRQERRAQVGGAAEIVLARPLNVEQFATALRVTSVVAIKRAARAGTPQDVAMAKAQSQVSGALARLVLNAGRETVTASVAADPRGVGCERVLGGAGCEFCQLLAGRGGVYSAETADFEAHDHCGCSAAPVYGD